MSPRAKQTSSGDEAEERSRSTSACASFRFGRAEEDNQVGQVTGLAWTEVGGELLTIEAAVVPGKGKHLHRLSWATSCRSPSRRR